VFKRLICVAGIMAGLAAFAQAEKPNIVYILADDMGYGDVAALNPNSKIPTPNFDRMAREGLSFSEAHTPSAVCTPTRYGVLTGRYSWRTPLEGVLNGYEPALINTKRMTVGSYLQGHGYRTACVGKWHLGLGTQEPVDYFEPLGPVPNDYGFDYSYIIPASLDMAPYLYLEDGVPVELPTDTVENSRPKRIGGDGYIRKGPIAPSFTFEGVLPTFTEKAVEFIENQAESPEDSPFFLYFPLNAPHTPWMATEEFQGVSGAGEYGDFVAQVDHTVGRVLDTLDRLNLADDTLVIVTSDNGAWWRDKDIEEFGHNPNAGRRGQKGDAWDGGHRVPFLVRWPGKVEAGAETDEIICHTDLLATVAAVMGEDLPDSAGEDSYNILPVFLGEDYQSPIREATVHFSSRHVYAIRQGKWKLILGRGSGGFTLPQFIEPEEGEPEGQLYNMDEDPLETTNLWAERPEIVEHLETLLATYQEQGHSRPMFSD